MTDLAATIAPKSDQLNADDLIGGPITIRVTGVKGSQTKEQPIDIHYEGDAGKPYKPCKSMRRVLVQLWGRDGVGYVGRSMTLYRDDRVRFGGVEVGGIRISHMSGIAQEATMALTASKTSRKPFTVKPLKEGGQGDGQPPVKAKAATASAPTPLNGGLPLDDSGENVLSQIKQLLEVKFGDGVNVDQSAVDAFLKGRDPSQMPDAALDKMLGELQAM